MHLDHPSAAAAPSPALLVPARSVVSIEHPCIIKDIDNGIKSLGDRHALDKFLNTKDRSKTIGASLRPDDPMAKPVMSSFTKTQNLLLRVSLPKRTGRRRKRGSDGPWLHAPDADTPPHTNARLLLQSLRDSCGNYTIHPVGLAHENHRFRQLPDFQYATSSLPLADMLRQTILPLEYPRLKNFKLDDERGNQCEPGVGPSAQFSMVEVPYNYGYRQNPAVKVTEDEQGRRLLHNPTACRKFAMHSVDLDATDVLHASPVPLPPEESLEPHVRDTIARMRLLLDERPIMTKRYLVNHIDAPTDDSIRCSYAYVGYSFKSGPWRDTLIKFGVDPRKDAQYRHYQTLMFKIVTPSKKESSDDPNKWMDARNGWRRVPRPRNTTLTTHIFDGKSLTPDGKVWQTCDITDPQLRAILDTGNLRSTCNARSDGWYLNGTWAKVKVLMRDKISMIMNSRAPRDDDYKRILDFPDLVTLENISKTVPGRNVAISEKESKMMAEIRNLAKQNLRVFQVGRETHDEGGEMAGLDPATACIVDDQPEGAEMDDFDAQADEDLDNCDTAIDGGMTDEDSDVDEDGSVDNLLGPIEDDIGSIAQDDDY